MTTVDGDRAIPFEVRELLDLAKIRDNGSAGRAEEGRAMDPKLLADTLTTMLAPALPFLVKGGEDVVRQAGKKLGEEGLDLAKKLWGKLRPKAEASPVVQAAVDEVAATPDNADAQENLSLQLRRALKADPNLAAELERMIEAAGPRLSHQATVHGSGAIAQGPGAVAAGKGGIAVGGSVHGNLSMDRARARGDRGPEPDE